MAWVAPSTTSDDRDRIIGAGSGTRVHAVEYGWLDAMRSVELYAYRLPADAFAEVRRRRRRDRPGRRLGPAQRVGDLFELHDEAGIQLRVLSRLHDFWSEVITSTLEWSGIRLRNARP